MFSIEISSIDILWENFKKHHNCDSEKIIMVILIIKSISRNYTFEHEIKSITIITCSIVRLNKFWW